MLSLTRQALDALTRSGFTATRPDDTSYYIWEKNLTSKAIRVVLTVGEQVDAYLFDLTNGRLTNVNFHVQFSIDTPAGVVLATVQAMEEAIPA